MESADERQHEEITVLQSIYAEDFLEVPPPKAWKGAARLPEFIIKVPHPDNTFASKVYFHLHVKLPKTYPSIACPIFTIQQPIRGLGPDHITKLSSAIHAEAQSSKGSEMVFQIITFAQDWLNTNIHPALETPDSLAIQMNKRASDEERARREREQELADLERQKASQLAQRLNEEIQADAQRQQAEKEKFVRARKRAESDATEVPSAGDTPTESFSSELEVQGVRFNSVKLFHPRKECLGIIYLADPVCDDVQVTLPLELHSVAFESPYYKTHQGRKKLMQLESEIQQLKRIRDPNLISIYAVKLTFPHSSGPPRLVILAEQRSSLTLHDVLEDSDALREDRATDYLRQILSGLRAIHANNLMHRGLSPRCICLHKGDSASSPKIVKLAKVSYYVRLQDLHRSNPFGPNVARIAEDLAIPEAWLPSDVVDSPLSYTTSRDIHQAGVVLLQMLLGQDIFQHFPDPQTALKALHVSPALHQVATGMLVPGKKRGPSCAALLADLPRRSSDVVRPTTIATRSRGTSAAADLRTPMPQHISSSPESDYFRVPAPRQKHSSRWKEDWEELELLGKGAFGSVVKARNKIDSRIYAVKKIKLRATQRDDKIFREVNALSRLSHRFIVRYYTTWVETSEPSGTPLSSGSDTESATEDGMTSVPIHHNSGSTSEGSTGSSNDPFIIDLDDLGSGTGSQSSFPSIHFTRSGSTEAANDTDNGSEEDDDAENSAEIVRQLFSRPSNGNGFHTPSTIARTLYIQMEFVERQTLKERVAEGLSEDEAWRLFMQLVDALVHMSTLGILHRDIKLTNIFIDGRGDCKVGDFGLATSSLAAVDPSDVSPHAVTADSDLTLEVGTMLYIAPEVQSPRRGPRNHNKADMYSLGVVFFEMNYFFSTGAERVAVIEDLRRPDIIFPPDWENHRGRQRQIISSLLQHDPNARPSALELSQSPLLPPRMEDESFKGVIQMMSNADSPQYQALLSALFTQPQKRTRGFLYDNEAELPEHASLNDTVEETLAGIFHLHGAVDMEPPLLMPIVNAKDEPNRVLLLDQHGEVVSLPNNALVPFARLAARTNIRRIKRYHIGEIFKPNLIAGHPKFSKAAVFDIITPDLENGPIAATAEAIVVVHRCLDSFPGIGQNYEIRISHSSIPDLALNRVSEEVRQDVIDIITQTKSSSSQKRALLLKKGLLRSTADELEILSDLDYDPDGLLSRLDKVSSTLASLMAPLVKDIKKVMEFSATAGVTKPIIFHPLMLGSHVSHFRDGVCFEVVRRNKRSDILAAGGRYDNLISQFASPKAKSDAVRAVAVQIAIEKITLALAAFQSTSVRNLVKEQKSFGFWSPRRCDVYVVSYHQGYLHDRLEVAALLWKNGISADVMYEAGLPDNDHESHTDLCAREGILFTVYPRPRSVRRDQPAFKIKSVLKGTEYEVARQDLVSWLQQQISEQKRVDASTSGVAIVAENPQVIPNVITRESSNTPDVQLLLPGDTKKQRKQAKQLFTDRAFSAGDQIKSAFQSGMCVVAVDVPPTVFDAMVAARNSAWVSDEEAWRQILNGFPSGHSLYAHQVRDAVSRKKGDGHRFVLLFSVRDERAQLLTLQ
ncbi:hypothetical protein JAAARDRAFT_37399 [Jaapia argillacea MUCL 33604]|uniref:non-specific serine/threonine protein kinase n=1 Tax=Jaapia argillacea MUCL 33604 TaxID=933084 RepID=A0A067PVR8_9AGAM|nr:hypothetical protein JAAARDRAFT_37399 [Jaapia argillacea MUCL 33604]